MQDVIILREEVRQLLKAAGTKNGGKSVRVSGEYDGEYYSNVYKLSDFTIYHEFEAPDLTDATNTFSLDTPLLILYWDEKIRESGTVDTKFISIEFQVAVNFNPHGFTDLLGYLELLRVIVNPRNKGLWLGLGLAPRFVELGPVVNGYEIKESLKDRVLVQSLIGHFTYIGAN